MIQSLRSRLGGPDFAPHLTVAGQVQKPREEVLGLFHSLADAGEPLRAAIRAVSADDEYYRSIIYPLKTNAQLQNLNFLARHLFQLESDPPYRPHVSLHYGELSATEKQRAIRALEQLNIQAIAFDRLTLVQTLGLAADWQTIQTIRL